MPPVERCPRPPPPPWGVVRSRPPRGLWTHGRSRPVPREFPRDLQLVGLLAERTLELTDAALRVAQLGRGRIGAAITRRRQRRLAALEEPVAPLVVERLGDPMFAANITHAAITAQPRHDDLELLVRGERPALALLPHFTPSQDHERPCPKPSGAGNRQHTTRVRVRPMLPPEVRQERAER